MFSRTGQDRTGHLTHELNAASAQRFLRAHGVLYTWRRVRQRQSVYHNCSSTTDSKLLFRIHVATLSFLPYAHHLVCQPSFHNIGADLSITMRVLAEASAGLHQVIIQHSQYPKRRVAGIGILCKRKVKATLQPNNKMRDNR